MQEIQQKRPVVVRYINPTNTCYMQEGQGVDDERPGCINLTNTCYQQDRVQGRKDRGGCSDLINTCY